MRCFRFPPSPARKSTRNPRPAMLRRVAPRNKFFSRGGARSPAPRPRYFPHNPASQTPLAPLRHFPPDGAVTYDQQHFPHSAPSKCCGLSQNFLLRPSRPVLSPATESGKFPRPAPAVKPIVCSAIGTEKDPARVSSPGFRNPAVSGYISCATPRRRRVNPLQLLPRLQTAGARSEYPTKISVSGNSSGKWS